MSANTNTDILLAGAIAAFSVDLLVYPLDTLKTRLQSPDYKRLYLHGSTQTVNKAALFRGLYQGVGSVIVATLPSSGAFFMTYEGVKHTISTHNPRVASKHASAHLLPQPVIHSVSSALAELVSCAILTPAEVIKQNAQMVRGGGSSSSSPSSSSSNATLQTLRRFRNNPLGLWRGYTALAGRNLPFTALQFPLFEKMKEGLKTWRDASGTRTGTLLESGVITAVSAGSAGSLAAVVTTPIDVVKTRIMLAAADETAAAAAGSSSSSQHHHNGDQKSKAQKSSSQALVDAFGKATTTSLSSSSSSSSSKQRRKSSWTIGREILRESGIKGLMRGGALRAVWTMIGSGLYLGVYESGRIYLARRRDERVDEEDLL